MRGTPSIARLAPRVGVRTRPARSPYVCWQCRFIQISASPTTGSPRVEEDAFGSAAGGARDSADARFEVLGSPYSLLSVTLSASQKLYTRRGTLVSVAGKAENAQSTLSILSPLRRAFLGIPFLYQRISSTTPITALIATRSPNTTFSVLHLDGTTDWMVAQRNALLAWTGHTLSASPHIRRGLPLAHWGNTILTGRGLAALTAPGQTYRAVLAEGEELALHPAHVVAYSVGRDAPQPYRLRSAALLSLQVPAVPASLRAAAGRLVPEGLARFWNAMRDTGTFKLLARLLFALRTTSRRAVWGDRLLLQFRGPATVLVSSRGARVRDVLTREEVNEMADTEAGTVPAAIELATHPKQQQQPAPAADSQPVSVHVAAVGRDGKVSFEDPKDLKEFVR